MGDYRRLIKPALVAALVASHSGLLEVYIDNQQNHTAPVRVCIFTSTDGFPDNPKKASVCLSQPGPQSDHFQFENIPYGKIAVSAYQDLNDNGVLDKGWFGIPKEPVGVSLGESGPARRPVFGPASFPFESPQASVRIKLRNH